MRRNFYDFGFNRFGNNTMSEHNELTVSYRNVKPIVDKSFYIPSSEAVKRIQRKNEASHVGSYDSEESLKLGLEPSWVRHPSRDIVEVKEFTSQLYSRIEKALQNDLSEAQKKTLEAEKLRVAETQKQIQSVLDEQKTVSLKE